MNYIQGSEVSIYLREYGTTAPGGIIACTKSDVLNLENEMLEVTQTEQYNTEFLPAFQNLNMSVEEAVVADVETGQIDTSVIEDWAVNQSLLDCVFERVNGTGGTRTYTGQCYIKSFSISGGVNTGALANFEIVWNGTPIIA